MGAPQRSQPLTAGGFITLLLMILLTGCTKVVERPPMDGGNPVQRSSVVTVRGEGQIPATGRFAWAPGAERVYQDQRLPAAMDRYFRESIIKAFQARGYHYSPDPAKAELQIGYLLALESALDSGQVRDQYGISPGLAGASPDDTQYEKGTVILDVLDPRTGRSLWRSALQAFATFDLPEPVRRQRIQQAVESMLASFP